MPRTLNTATLAQAGMDYASWFMADRPPFDRAYVMRQFHNFTFKDEFAYMIEAVRSSLGATPRKAFDAEIDTLVKNSPRDDAVFHKELADRLAITPEGDHIAGKIGRVDLGRRFIGMHTIEVETPWSIRAGKAALAMGLGRGPRITMEKMARLYWPIYAGEGDERAAGSGVADPLPDGTPGLPLGALNTRISNEVALLMCDACVDNLDEGTLGAVIQGRSGAQPTDPDTTVTGTNLFTLTCSTTAFGAAADAAPGAIATAAAITDDSSADATDTLGYCRASSSSVADTPLDDHIDGEAGTSGADFNFNTLSIVSGATVSMSSWTITMPES